MWTPHRRDRALLESVPAIVKAYFVGEGRLHELDPAAAILVKALNAPYRYLRQAAILSLKAMYGTDHGYCADAPQPQRAKAAAFWQSYLRIQ